MSPSDGGVLTQAAVLTATSNGLRTQPIKRGAFVLEEILADQPKPSKAEVPAVEDLVPAKPLATLRERLEQHRNDPSCMNCHRKIDPLGFALENWPCSAAHHKGGTESVNPFTSAPAAMSFLTASM